MLLLLLVVLQVLAIGSGVTLKLSVGDKVVFNKYAMAEVEVPDGDILFVAEKSILGKLE
jgi:chaperonin GroES